MEPPPGRRSPSRRAGRIAAALVPLLTAGCGLLPTGPAESVTPTPSTSTVIPSPPPTSATPTAATHTRSAQTAPSGFPTNPRPAEAACALPTDPPASVSGADGPTLTSKRVEKAWRASAEGKANRVTTGTLTGREAEGGSASPAQVLLEAGVHYTGVSHFEWTGLRTYVFANPGRAAAKLAAVRLMMDRPCSYQFGSMGRYVVAELKEDAPDMLVVAGVMDNIPVTDVFVRYGNTVTDFSAIMAMPESGDVVPLVHDALDKA